MSEPTLYREHFTDETEVELGKEGWIFAGTDDEFGIVDRWMVPVERCEHADPEYPNGHIDGHWITFPVEKNQRVAIEGEWCPGAGIGNDDALCRPCRDGHTHRCMGGDCANERKRAALGIGGEDE